MNPEYEIDHGDARDGHTLWKIFVISLIIGIAGVVLGALVGPSWWSIALTVVAPVAAMALYLVLATSIHASRVARSQVGDAFYYLGFLFTLASLLASLGAISQADYGIRELGSRFAVALGTTFIGLAGRMYFTMIRSTAKDSLEKAEHALTVSTERLRKHIQTLSVDVVAQNNVYKSSLAKLSTDTTSELEKVVREGAAQITSAGSRAHEVLDGVLSELKQTLTEQLSDVNLGTKQSLAEFRKAVSDTCWRLTRAATSFETRIESIEIPSTALVEPLDEPLQKLTLIVNQYSATMAKLLESHEKVIRATDQLNTAVEKTAKGSEQLAETAITFSSSRESLASFRVECDRLSAQTATLTSSIKSIAAAAGEIGGASKTLASQVEAESHRFREYHQRLLRSAEEGEEALTKVHGQLIEAAQYVQKQLSD